MNLIRRLHRQIFESNREAVLWFRLPAARTRGKILPMRPALKPAEPPRKKTSIKLRVDLWRAAKIQAMDEQRGLQEVFEAAGALYLTAAKKKRRAS